LVFRLCRTEQASLEPDGSHADVVTVNQSEIKHMLRAFRLAAAALTVVVPVISQAQDAEPKRITFGVSAGLSMPLGRMGDAFDSGFNLTGHVGLQPAMFTNLSFRGDVSFDRFNAKKSIGALVQEGTFTAIGVSANAVYGFPQSDPSAMLRPYVLGGIGFYNGKNNYSQQLGSAAEIEVESSDSNLGVQAGAGIDFKLSGFTTFAELKFVNVFSEGSSTRWVPISFGFRF
jgi:opacity protein-like surface antigen